MTKNFQPDLQRGDIVSGGKYKFGPRGQFVRFRTATEAVVTVPGEPSCIWPIKTLKLIARPTRYGFDVYYEDQKIGEAKDLDEVRSVRFAAASEAASR